MADKSKVADAYAEVRADLSKLPSDLGKVPGLMKRMISTDGLKAVREILTGNVSGGLAALATRGYTLQAEKLREIAKAAMEAKKKLEEMAGIAEQKAGDKSLSGGDRAGHAARAQKLREAAAGKQATADEMNKRAGSAEAAGGKLGGKVMLAAKVGMAAIAAVAAVAAAYFATTVAAAHKASADLKTAQMVRATGEAAGWSAEKLQHMGEQLRKNSKFSQADVSGGQQALLKNPNIKGEQFEKALKAAADLASVMGTTLPQAASELGDLLADPMKAAEGGLEKYGVILNATEQGQIRNAMAARDYARAQELVLGHLKGFSGAAGEAANTGVGGFEKLKNSVIAAAASIGGAGGDIGALAAKVADLLDKFMALQVVKDLIDLAIAPFRIMYQEISAFIEENRADFEAWGEQISEIYHNVRDNILAAWEAVKEASRQACEFILGVFGTSWGEIKETVTAVLDEISLLTTNFGLTAQYVWLKIQLGAQNLWDGLRDGLAGLAVSFEAMWDAVAAGAEAAWENVKNTFNDKPAVDIGAKMSEAFNKGIADGAKKWNFGDSQAAKDLRKQIDEVRGQMEAARGEVRDKRAKELAAKEAKLKELEKPGKGTDYKSNKPFKFEFVGFEEMSKKIQTSLFPSEAIQLQKAGVAAAEKAVDNGAKANALLEDLNKNVKKIGMKP